MELRIVYDNLGSYIPYFAWNEGLCLYYNRTDGINCLQNADLEAINFVGQRIGIQSSNADSCIQQFYRTVIEFCGVFYPSCDFGSILKKMSEDKFYVVSYERRILLTEDKKAKTFKNPNLAIAIFINLGFSFTEQNFDVDHLGEGEIVQQQQFNVYFKILHNIDIYEHYYKWNEALRKHYFDKKKENILLYVDEKIIEKVGSYNKIPLSLSGNYKEDFERTVLEFSDVFYESKNILRNSYTLRNDIFSTKCKNSRLLFTENGNPIQFDVPFLSIVLYILLKVDNGDSQQWENVTKALMLTPGETLDRDSILPLWESISAYNPLFDKDASVYERRRNGREDYIGRLKYHLPLPSSVRGKIHDAIYKSSAWKLIGLVPATELISRIQHSIKDDKTKETITRIITSTFSNRDEENYAVSFRKLQSVIEDFDIDDYLSKLEERSQKTDFKKSIISGEFALGLFYPDDNSGMDNSVVLLTTVQQEVDHNGYFIAEGDSGTLDGYNTYFVKVNGSESVAIKEYSITKNGYSINPIKIEDVVFFYKFDEGLYIQTRTIIPAASYVIAVKTNAENKFEEWCKTNNNDVFKRTDTADLLGEGWSYYYSFDALKGQYYEIEDYKEQVSTSNKVSRGGGIYNNEGRYFINALPYFEIPDTINTESLKIYININGVLFEDYEKIYASGKLIIDIKSTPVLSDDVAYCDISIYEKDSLLLHEELEIVGQGISFDPSSLYRYDKYGNRTEEEQACFYGNTIPNIKQALLGASNPNVTRISEISEDFYFINLLAACCYNAESSEIGHDKFRKCVNYASTRLGIDPQQAGFIRDVKRLFARAGIISIDYARSKYQAIPPLFSRCPYSRLGSSDHRLYLLSGCYTKVFLADLLDFCKRTHVEVFRFNIDHAKKDVDKFLPPVVLIGSNFLSQQFRDEYNHQFDVIENYDMAYALIEMIPDVKSLSKSFSKFTSSKENELYLNLPKESLRPRIRDDKNVHHKHWYFENTEGQFALIDKSMLPWASIHALRCKNKPMVIVRNNNILITRDVLLPIYLQRALYMMNLGLPKTEKVFFCNDDSSNGYYYSLMDKYYLGNGNETRATLLALKLTGEAVNATGIGLARKELSSNYKLSFWKSKDLSHKYTSRYLVLTNKSGNQVVAIKHNDCVYVNCNGILKKVLCESANKGLSFIICENWQPGKGYSAIGYSRQMGAYFETKYKLTDGYIDIPNKDNFNIEDIIIA